MARVVLRLVTVAWIALAHGSVAAPLAASDPSKPAAQADSEFTLPPPHGSPKELATGGTRGLSLGPAHHTRALLDVQPDGAQIARSGPRPLTATKP